MDAMKFGDIEDVLIIGDRKIREFISKQKKLILVSIVLATCLALSVDVYAAQTQDVWADSFYNLVMNAAQGHTARAICIVGGLMGLIWAAGNGKLTMALLGVGASIFGVLSPTIINAVFGSAMI